MPKVITIRDDVYQRLAKIKRMRGESFSQTIEYLLNVAEKSEKAKGIYNLEGILIEGYINKRRLRRLEHGEDMY